MKQSRETIFYNALRAIAEDRDPKTINESALITYVSAWVRLKEMARETLYRAEYLSREGAEEE